MNRKTVFRMILPTLLVFFALGAKAEEPQAPQMDPIEIQIADIKLDDLLMIDIVVPEPTMIERVQSSTSEFLDRVQSKLRETAASGYVWFTNGADLKKEIHCLAQNIYYEARGEPIEGKLAIANATINRVRSFLYPQTVCGVVWQPSQFSWTKMHIKYKTPHDQAHWEQAEMIAERALEGGRLDNLEDVTEGATNFHAVRVHPKWRKDTELEKTVKIGNHIFYRLKVSIVEPVVNGGQ